MSYQQPWVLYKSDSHPDATSEERMIIFIHRENPAIPWAEMALLRPDRDRLLQQEQEGA
jgi:hypothetical protein